MSSQSFSQQVYTIVASIPPGKVATYGQIAMLLGKPLAARQVGNAMNHAPVAQKLPCHRVVNRVGTLAPEHAFGGSMNQRMMLESEGVTFLPDGRIALEKHIWVP